MKRNQIQLNILVDNQTDADVSVDTSGIGISCKACHLPVIPPGKRGMDRFLYENEDFEGQDIRDFSYHVSVNAAIRPIFGVARSFASFNVGLAK